MTDPNYGQQSYGPGTDLDTQWADENMNMYTGFEDFDVSDARLARLTIDHKGSPEVGLIPAFVDSLSGQRMQKLQIIPLVFGKKRIMWPAVMSDEADAQPICKSVDNKVGFPTLDAKKKHENYDFAAAMIDPKLMQINPINNRMEIPCEICRFKEWGSNPIPGKEQPWCNQTREIPVMYGAEDEPPTILAVITFKGTSIRPCNDFFAGIAASGRATRTQIPVFSVVAEITLQHAQKGSNVYQIPVFRKVANVDRSRWMDLSIEAKQAADIIRQIPRGDENEDRPDSEDLGNASGTWTPAAPAAHVNIAPPQAPPTVITSHVVTTPPPMPPTPVQPAQVFGQPTPAPYVPPVPPVAPVMPQPIPAQRQPEPQYIRPVVQQQEAPPTQTPDPWVNANDDEGLPF